MLDRHVQDEIVIVDFIGSICACDDALRQEMCRIALPGDQSEVYTTFENCPDWILARQNLITSLPDFWQNLAPSPIGFDVLRNVEGIGLPIHLSVSRVQDKVELLSSKVAWCKKHIPEIDVLLIEGVTPMYGSVLVSDYMPYWQGWLKNRPRGVVIVPAQPWNVGAEAFDPTRVYRYDRSDIRPLHRILTAVKNRKDGEKINVQEIVESCKGLAPL